MNELALFAGAGGGILGGKLLGWRTVCAVEIDEYARSVSGRVASYQEQYQAALAADPEFPARFVFSLARQRTHLRRALRAGLVGHEAVAALKALIAPLG